MSDFFEVTDRRRVGRGIEEPVTPKGAREEVRSWRGIDVVVRVDADGFEHLDHIVDPAPETLKSRPDTWTCKRHGVERDLNPEGAAEQDKRCLQDIVKWNWTMGYGIGYGPRGVNDAHLQLDPGGLTDRTNNLSLLGKLIGHRGG